MTAHDVASRVFLCLLGAGMFIAGILGTVKQGWWRQ